MVPNILRESGCPLKTLGQLVFRKGGTESDVGEKVEGALVVLLQEGGLKAGFLLGSEGVKVAAHIVKATQNVVSLAVLRAFEYGVLHEVGKTVLLRLLVACAGFHHQHQMGDFALFLFVYQPDSVW